MSSIICAIKKSIFLWNLSKAGVLKVLTYSELSKYKDKIV